MFEIENKWRPTLAKSSTMCIAWSLVQSKTVLSYHSCWRSYFKFKPHFYKSKISIQLWSQKKSFNLFFFNLFISKLILLWENSGFCSCHVMSWFDVSIVTLSQTLFQTQKAIKERHTLKYDIAIWVYTHCFPLTVAEVVTGRWKTETPVTRSSDTLTFLLLTFWTLMSELSH